MHYADALPVDAGRVGSRFTCDAVKGNPKRATLDCDPRVESRLAAIERRLDLVPEEGTTEDEATAGSAFLPAPGNPDDATSPAFRGVNKTGSLSAGRNSTASAVHLGSTGATAWDGKPPTREALTNPAGQGGDRRTQSQMRDSWVRQDVAARDLVRSISKKWHKV